MINFDCTSNESKIIFKIVDRAIKKIDSVDKITLSMDLTACHCNGNKLKLEELLVSEDSDFFHDVIGIYSNINRNTGKLENCFLPRFSLK